MSLRYRTNVICALLFASAAGIAAQEMLTLRSVRLKLSAGDLPSAESLVEVHKADKGEDKEYLMCLGWLARGATLTRDWTAAARYSKMASDLAMPKIRAASFKQEPEAAAALGASIEVKSQILAAHGNKGSALRYMEHQLIEYKDAPVAFRSRIQRSWNLLGLTGRRAPDFAVTGQPVVLFLWAEWCGDCKAQAAALRRVVDKYRSRVKFIAPTRFYGDDPKAEREQVAKVWRESYPGLESVSVEISEPAMLHYGVSATPTFVLIDRKGIVRLYSPTRMTEERLSAAIETLILR